LFPQSRLIRFPIDIRGAKKVKFGSGLTTGKYCRIEALGDKDCLELGKNIEINDFVHITSLQKVYIGDNVLIASKVYISDVSHGNYSGDETQDNPDSIPNKRALYAKSVTINSNSWIGESVSVLPGVEIGKGCIIGANSVVTKSIPAYSIAVGNPAKVIKSFNFVTEKWERI
jgi:lipopolysaccharide O-acetyltransferase